VALAACSTPAPDSVPRRLSSQLNESVGHSGPYYQCRKTQDQVKGIPMNKKSVLAVAVALMLGFSAHYASAEADPMVGGAAMYPTKNIVENAVNEAFDKLPAGTVDTLLKPENLDQLKKILTYHVVAGKLTAKDIAKQIKAGGGKATLTTVEGGTLTATMQGGKFILTDEKGGTATVTIANVIQSNGVIQVIDTVLMPN
jgi:hypothetical protein